MGGVSGPIPQPAEMPEGVGKNKSTVEAKGSKVKGDASKRVKGFPGKTEGSKNETLSKRSITKETENKANKPSGIFNQTLKTPSIPEESYSEIAGFDHFSDDPSESSSSDADSPLVPRHSVDVPPSSSSSSGEGPVSEKDRLHYEIRLAADSKLNQEERVDVKKRLNEYVTSESKKAGINENDYIRSFFGPGEHSTIFGLLREPGVTSTAVSTAERLPAEENVPLARSFSEETYFKIDGFTTELSKRYFKFNDNFIIEVFCNLKRSLENILADNPLGRKFNENSELNDLLSRMLKDIDKLGKILDDKDKLKESPLPLAIGTICSDVTFVFTLQDDDIDKLKPAVDLWNKAGFEGKMIVDFNTFYESVILKVFPGKEGDDTFKTKITDLIDILGGEITAITWLRAYGAIVEEAGTRDPLQFLTENLEGKGYQEVIKGFRQFLSGTG